MLSDREKEILALAGLGDKEIAKLLHITAGTVKRCFADMRAKYKVKNRTMLLLKAIKEKELHIVDMGFFNYLGQYQEDLQVLDMRRV